jgi:hypothetical protein
MKPESNILDEEQANLSRVDILRRQLEFYMGDSNLMRDKFLQEKLKENPNVPFKLFYTFNKVKKIFEKMGLRDSAGYDP